MVNDLLLQDLACFRRTKNTVYSTSYSWLCRDLTANWILSNFDISMEQLMNAKEREMDECTALIVAVDRRLKLAGVKIPEDPTMAFLEIA